MPTTGCKKGLLSFLSLCFFSMPALSASGHGYLGASVGASYANIGNSAPQYSYSSGAAITDAYPLNKTYTSSSIFSANGGYEFSGERIKPAIALGLGVYSNGDDYSFGGQVIETAAGNPSSTLFNYSYNLNTTRVMAEVQLSWMLGRFAPFVNVGVGPTWNRLSNYTETATTSSGYPPLPGFQSHTSIRFAYQVGLGVSAAFNWSGQQSDFRQERVSLGYRYANLGTTTFGSRGAAYPFNLNTGLLHTNEVYLSYTHLF